VRSGHEYTFGNRLRGIYESRAISLSEMKSSRWEMSKTVQLTASIQQKFKDQTYIKRMTAKAAGLSFTAAAGVLQTHSSSTTI
jgi:hypothetical protein